MFSQGCSTQKCVIGIGQSTLKLIHVNIYNITLSQLV